MKKAKNKATHKEQIKLNVNPNANTALLKDDQYDLIFDGDPLYTWIILEGLKKYKEGTAGKCTIQFLQHMQILI